MEVSDLYIYIYMYIYTYIFFGGVVSIHRGNECVYIYVVVCLGSNFDTVNLILVNLVGLLSELLTNKESRDHIKTQPSYHHPGPPYT